MSDLGYYTLKEIREDARLFEDDFGLWLEHHGVEYGMGFTPLIVATDDCLVTDASIELNVLKLGIKRLIDQAGADAD
jgi:hypothetical protein